MVEWLERLGYGAETCCKVVCLRHATTGKLSLSTQQKMGTVFESGKDKAVQGGGCAPPFISCAQDTVGLQPLTAPTAIIGYGKPIPLPHDL